jgi:preprotein translocase subunit SecF
MHIIRNKKFFLILASVIVLGSLAVVAKFGLQPGIDFTGGSLLEVHYASVPEKVLVEQAVSDLKFEHASIRKAESETGSGYLITTRALTEEERQGLTTALSSLGEGGQVTQFTSIGPVIGAELADKAVWGIGAVVLLIIVYVAIAFSGVGAPVSSWVYGFFTIVVLGHDILLPVTFMSLMGYFTGAQADVLFVTVLLTILGFSVNDTIVIFDRIREKLKGNRTETRRNVPVPGGKDDIQITYTLTKPFGDIVGEAIDETMTRSINTSLTVVLSLIALYFFGSAVTKVFSLTLLVGVIAGAYSSIFIASPLLVFYQELQAKKENKKYK